MSTRAPSTVQTGSNTGRRLDLALLVIATAQLMLVLDDTVANVALPSIQIDLGMTTAALPWVINAYVLTFGGLLLFGGRLGDLYGRRRVLRVGLAVFTLASLLGGLAPSGELLIAARIVQGIGAALAAPNALALIATTFPAGKPRNKAMAVYGAMSALGIIGGLLLGGLLTGALSWRWVLLINIPIGVAVLFGTRTLTGDQRHAGRLDALGAGTGTGTGGVMALAYAFTRSGEHGWTDPLTLTAFAAAAVLLVLFVVLQAHKEHPLLPLRLLEDRNRAGSYATVLCIGAGLMGTFYLATLFMQQVLLYGPLRAGAAALPFGIGIVLASGVASKLAQRLSPRAIAVPGLLLGAAGMVWLSTLQDDSGYWTHLMVPVFLASAGLGLAFVPMTLTVVHGVDPQETGVASALLNTGQQVGAALGLAVLTTVSASAAATTLPDAPQALHRAVTADDQALVARAAEALAHGYGAGFLAAAGLLVVAATITGFTVTVGPQQPHDDASSAATG